MKHIPSEQKADKSCYFQYNYKKKITKWISLIK